MRVRITTRNLAMTETLRELVYTRLEYALDRLAHRIDDAAVSFEDVNGPRGGQDVQCRIKLLLRPRGEINVSATADSPGAAMSEAVQRASRCLKSQVRRRWTLRRRTREPIIAVSE